MLPKAPQCPSVELAQPGPTGKSFSHEPCTKCSAWWTGTGCSAGPDLETNWAQHLDKGPLPPCGLAKLCRWDMDALAAGKPGCVPRRLGMLCEHQGGDWNTFDMADPADLEP